MPHYESSPQHSSRLSLNRLLAKTKAWRNKFHPSDDDRSPSSSLHSESSRGPELSFFGGTEGTSPQSSTGARDDQILDRMFALLSDPHPAVREKALSTVFHLAQSSASARDQILAAGGLQPILSEIQRRGPEDAQSARAIFHLCIGDPMPPFHLIVQALASLQRLLVGSDDEEVLVITLYVLGEIVTKKDLALANYINKVIPPPLHVRLITLLAHESIDVRYRSLILLKRIAAADRIHGAKASGSQCADWFSPNLSEPLRRNLIVPELQDETIELIQNLMVHHLDKLIKNEDLIHKYFQVVRSRLGFEAKVLTSLCTIMRNADNSQLRYLKEVGCLEVLEKTVGDYETVMLCKPEVAAIRAQLIEG